MDAIISDLTGKTVAKNQSYKIDVFNRSTGCHLEFDTESNEQLMNMLSLSIQNGQKWYKITKNQDTGKWERKPLETQPLQ